jgi:hypothetical protein
LWYLTFGGGTPQTGLTKQLYFVAGPSLEHNLGQGLFGRIIAAGEGDGPDSSARSAAGMSMPLSAISGTGLAPIAVQLLSGASTGGASQGAGMAGDAAGLPAAASQGGGSITAQQTTPTLASPTEPILQNSGTTTDVLDSFYVGFANGQADGVGTLPL